MKINSFKSYLLLITLVSLAIGAILFFTLSAEDNPTVLKRQVSFILIGAYYIIGAATAGLLFGYIRRRPGLFIRAYMGSSTVKFLILLGLLIGLVFRYREMLIFVTIVFFSLYVLYTVFEKAIIFKAYKNISNQEKPEDQTTP